MDDNHYFNSIDNAPKEPATVSADKNSGRGIFLIGMLAGMAVTMLVIGVCYVGFGFQKNNNKTSPEDSITVQVDDKDGDTLIDAATIKKLKVLASTIDKYFYLEKVDNDTLRDGMYKGLMSALNDPYTEYYTEEELNEMLDSTEGIYYGIGAYVSLDAETKLPKISGIIKNSPAEDADLRANDIVYEINGESAYGLSLNDAVKLIKGPEGTDVVLTIVREGEKSTLDVTLTRRKVETPTVEFSMEEDDMALIQVTEFDDVTVEQFEKALADARENNAKGIILDLRANPGGNLSAVVDMCRMILPKGMIVYTEDMNGKRTEFESDGKRELELPLVVLVDMNSASAAEIMSGAIKDYGIGTLVGTTTFGKGIVQQIVPYRDGTAVKITISAYYTPSGKNIHGIGIEPDVVCEFDSEAYYDKENPVDNQLEKAKEVLREKINQ